MSEIPEEIKYMKTMFTADLKFMHKMIQRAKEKQIQKLRVWCTKCDKPMKNNGIALDCPEDGVFYKCPSCNYRIVIFPKEV